VVLFDHMLADLEATYCVDERAVFAAGFSWGGDFVAALACCRGDRLRAVAASSCTDDFRTPTDPTSYENLPCPAAGHAAIRFTFDPAHDPAVAPPYYASTRALFASMNGCSSVATPGSAAVSPCVTYEGCSAPFVECPYPGLGHALPASWSVDTWGFFASFLGKRPSIEARAFAPAPARHERAPLLLAFAVVALGALLFVARRAPR
jgi:polyhydroxybutyrate depolymerase